MVTFVDARVCVCASFGRRLLAVMPDSVPAAGALGYAFSVRLLVHFAMLKVNTSVCLSCQKSYYASKLNVYCGLSLHFCVSL